MQEIATILTIAYVLSTMSLVLVILYPLFKGLTLDMGFPSSKSGAEAISAMGAAMAAIFGFFWFLAFVVDFATFLVFVVSLFSGLELIHWTRVHKLNLLLFLVSVALSVVPFVISELGQPVYLIEVAIYMVGVGEGAGKHILPIAKSLYSDFHAQQSYAEVFVALWVIVCFLTMMLPFSGTDILASYSTILSDMGFAGGGVLAYVVGSRLKKLKENPRF